MSHRGFIGKKRGVDPCVYVPSLYTQEEVDDLINIDGYIPVATAGEFDSIRTGSSETMGGCSIWAGSYTTGLDKKYIQIFNIDFLNGNPNTGSNKQSGFIYDGNDLSLSNFSITSALFLNLGVGTNVKNVKIADSSIVLSSTSSGGQGILATVIESGATVEDFEIINCSFNGNGFTQSDGVGLVCGELNGVAKNFKISGTVTSAQNNTGGAFGSVFGEAFNSYADVAVTCTSTSALSNVGGYVGIAQGGANIYNSYALGGVTGSGGRVGGFVGVMTFGTVARIIKDCYAYGDVSGDTNVGGFAGFMANVGSYRIETSYSIGSATGNSAVGGFIGTKSANATVEDCYWDTESSGNATSSAGTGKTTSELQTPTSNTGIYSAWTIPPWDFGTDTEYPILSTTP